MKPRLLDNPEFEVLKPLTTPRKIQDFLDTIPAKKESPVEPCTSALVTLRRNKAHCMEGALVAALALWMHGQPPLILDLKSTSDDVDHLVVLFRKNGYWGGITQTNHPRLPYRKPIYRDVRETPRSFIPQYFLDIGKK